MISSSEILHGKILIVDDLEANVRLLDRMLRGAGYVCITSTMDPREVCELYRKNRYDLILLDLQMSGMDGFQVMEGLNKIEPDSYLPVLVITAQPDHKLRALQASARDFISKPFDLTEVLARVHNILEVRLLHEVIRMAGGARYSTGSAHYEYLRHLRRPAKQAALQARIRPSEDRGHQSLRAAMAAPSRNILIRPFWQRSSRTTNRSGISSRHTRHRLIKETLPLWVTMFGFQANFFTPAFFAAFCKSSSSVASGMPSLKASSR